MVHAYTETGYSKTKIPPKVYKDIHNTYLANYGSATDYDRSQPHSMFVNYPEHPKVKHIPIPSADADRIAEELKPSLEEWCGEKLNFVSFDGVWENQEKSQWFKSVEDLDSLHVISATLLIARDAEGENWQFDIVEFDGLEQLVTLNNGEMLMYESAKLIVGKKGALKGKSYAECTFHYVPSAGWPFGREEQEFINYETGFREPTGNVITDLTINKRAIPQHDEF